MAAYVIANITVHDPEAYKNYAAVVPETIVKHGGWYVGRAATAGDAEVVEGDFRPGRFVIIGFENKVAALGWYNLPEYQEAAGLRQPVSDADVFIIDEVPAGLAPTRDWGEWR